MEKILWTDYIIINNPDGVNAVLKKYGYLPASDFNEARDAIAFLLQEEGHNATVDLMLKHPDYTTIVETEKQINPETFNAIGETSPIETHVPVQQQQPSEIRVSQAQDTVFSNTFQNVVLVIAAFWLLKKIVSD